MYCLGISLKKGIIQYPSLFKLWVQCPCFDELNCIYSKPISLNVIQGLKKKLDKSRIQEGCRNTVCLYTVVKLLVQVSYNVLINKLNLETFAFILFAIMCITNTLIPNILFIFTIFRRCNYFIVFFLWKKEKKSSQFLTFVSV